MTQYFKCKFCDWKTQKWSMNKKGKAVNRYSLLERHVIRQHKEEYQKILDHFPLDFNIDPLKGEEL